MTPKVLLVPGLVPLLALLASPASAAESYDSCKGFIAALPAAIDGQGVYCLNKDLTSNLETGYGIEVKNSNVTIDCNGFKIGNLQAGFDNLAFGVYAVNRANVTVRNCNVRGYSWGVFLTGSGHLVEDNRVEASGTVGILAWGDGSTIRRNFVLDTGTGVYHPEAAISASGLADVVDNTVTGVYGAAGSASPIYGIYLNPSVGGRVEGNAIRGLLVDGTGDPYGLFVNNTGGGVSVARNRIVNAGAADGTGVQCAGTPSSLLVDNHVIGFTDGWSAGCTDVGLNQEL
jgi:hypothetical protein